MIFIKKILDFSYQISGVRYIDYAKFEEMTQRGVIYVTKMKKNLTYETVKSAYYVNDNGQIQWREEIVVFRKEI